MAGQAWPRIAGCVCRPRGLSGMPVARVPRHQEIARELRARIESGRLRPGEPLPDEAALSAQLGVARRTIRAAINQLTVDGAIVRIDGVPCVAQRNPAVFTPTVATLGDLLQLAQGTTRDIRSVVTGVMEPATAALLRVEAGRRWVRVSFVRLPAHGGGLPLGWYDSFIDEQFSSIVPHLRRHRGLYTDLIEAHHGVLVAEVHQEISAAVIPPAMAEPLQAPAGSPALRIVRRYLDRRGAVLVAADGIHPADRFAILTILRRERPGPGDR